ncbi:N-acetylmuramate alpha-1-phosphate uridylyltransferase MurU [Legionella fallonii]|uniref:Mannose-1-phosphate guanyltransferase n=1 Tax=Legionella fallonii LLAP-10 TaxID=1212491 RepID=A0A098G1C1_9GAMM|nr:nucleotidyltransferase family protein [Legionella fallonii]CEG55779.1 Mannose-1-phosphate guanyltransferase [Legionella fallonii LLAP-10]
MNTAMILAAGRGERLRPLTELCPKALCIVKGKPLVEHHVINLAKAGFEKIIINHAYLGGQIRRYLGDGSRWGVELCYSPEPPGGLETGGGIIQALPFFDNKPFITVNADIYTDYDFKQIKTFSVDCLHLILVHKNPALQHHGDFGLNNEHILTNTDCNYTFAGIACYHPKIFTENKLGRYSIAPLLKHYASRNEATGSLHQGFWFDIGSIERLNAANSF